MKKIADMTKKIAERTLTKEANSMCIICFNQPKEPKGMDKFKKVK